MVDPGRNGELLAQLGLAPGATRDEVAAAHAGLVAYLGAAPRAVRPWARQQLLEVEAAYSTLARELHRPAAPAMARATVAARYVASDADDAEELLDALDDGAPASGRQRITVKPGRANAVRESRPSGVVMGAPGRQGMRRLALGVGGLAIALVAVMVIYKLGEPSVPGLTGSPAPGATAAGLDTARVATLMGTLATNPGDLPTLRELANLYYDAGDFATSRTWLAKILAIDPKDVEALLGAGANAYNLNDLTDAEAKWQAVIAIDPKNVDAHYDLGLMYFSKDPPDLTRMREEWSKVIALAPDSELASIVRTHMPDPSGSPGPAGSGSVPSGAPSPAPTAAASPG